MKRILFTFCLFATLSLSLNAQTATTTTDGGAKITFEQTVLDYGTIEQGSDPYRVFTFTNTGDDVLLITNARGSCGCTTVNKDEYTQPVEPGQSSTLKVRYDTNRVGPFTKSVTLSTNAGDQPVVLTIKGKVEKKADEAIGTPEKAETGMFGGGN